MQPAGYRVLRVGTGAEAQQQARSARPDCIVIATPLPDVEGAALCEALRRDPAIMPGVPVIGITSGAVARELRLSWLRAGAWDVFGFPLDSEELLLKLEAYLGGRREAEAAGEGTLVDRATGLYNARGLRRRARELVAEAVRLHAALACALFGFDAPSEQRDAAHGAAGPPAIRDRLGSVVRTHGRLSDTIGWWNGAELAILAPATDADGAAQLARRFAHAIETAPPEPGVSAVALDVRVGYEAVTDLRASPVKPDDLLVRASAALQRARAEPRGVRIQRFAP